MALNRAVKAVCDLLVSRYAPAFAVRAARLAPIDPMTDHSSRSGGKETEKKKCLLYVTSRTGAQKKHDDKRLYTLREHVPL
jgi:hypothetical protein